MKSTEFCVQGLTKGFLKINVITVRPNFTQNITHPPLGHVV